MKKKLKSNQTHYKVSQKQQNPEEKTPKATHGSPGSNPCKLPPTNNQLENQKGKVRRKKKKYDTLKKELLNSLIGIHGTLLKHCINLILSGIHCDLLDVIDHLLYVDWDWNPAGPTNAHLCKPRNLINTQNKITTKPHQHQYHHRPQSVNLSSSSSSSFKRLEKKSVCIVCTITHNNRDYARNEVKQKKKKKNLNFFPFFQGFFWIWSMWM